jgi:hypothetical protein
MLALLAPILLASLPPHPICAPERSISPPPLELPAEDDRWRRRIYWPRLTIVASAGGGLSGEELSWLVEDQAAPPEDAWGLKEGRQLAIYAMLRWPLGSGERPLAEPLVEHARQVAELERERSQRRALLRGPLPGACVRAERCRAVSTCARAALELDRLATELALAVEAP